MNSSSLFKTTMLLFMILWELWRCVVHICTNFIVIQRKVALICSSKVFSILWITQMMGYWQLGELIYSIIFNLSFFTFKVTNIISIKVPTIRVFAMYMHDEWYVVVVMKLQCFITTISLIEAFTQKFPSLELMNAIGLFIWNIDWILMLKPL